MYTVQIELMIKRQEKDSIQWLDFDLADNI